MAKRDPRFLNTPRIKPTSYLRHKNRVRRGYSKMSRIIRSNRSV